MSRHAYFAPLTGASMALSPLLQHLLQSRIAGLYTPLNRVPTSGQQAGLDQSHRLHRLLISGGYGEILLPQAYLLKRAIDQLDRLDILAYSPNHQLPMEALLGQQLLLQTRLCNGQWRPRSGYIHQIDPIHSDGGLSYYHIQAHSGASASNRNLHTRVFRNSSSLDIIQQLLGDYRPQLQLNILAHVWQHEPANRIHPSRTQQQQSDWQFARQLMHQAGLSCVLIDPSPTAQAQTELSDISAQQLVIFHDSQHLNPDPIHVVQGQLIYASSNTQHQQDSIQQLSQQQQRIGQPSISVYSDSNGHAHIHQGHAHATARSPAQLTPASQYHLSPSLIQNTQHAQNWAQQLSASSQQQQHHISSIGSQRSLQTGEWFDIALSQEHPSSQQNTVQRYLTIAHQEIGIEPQPSSQSGQQQPQDWLRQQLSSGHPLQHLIDSTAQRGYSHYSQHIDQRQGWTPHPHSQHLTCDDLQHSLIQSAHPKGIQLSHSSDGQHSSHPKAHSYTDAQGNISHQPHWQQLSPHDQGQYPPTRITQPQHGQHHSLQHLPRLNQQLGYLQLHQDPDSPILHAQLYDGIGAGDQDTHALTSASPQPSTSQNLRDGNSPRWHGAGQRHSQHQQDDHHAGHIQGISHHSLDQQYSSHLLLDDHPDQLGLELQLQSASLPHPADSSNHSTPAHQHGQYQLHLGQQIHRLDNHRSSSRGQGLLLSSDHSSHIQASQGLVLSSYSLQHTDQRHDPAFELSGATALAQHSQAILQQHNQGKSSHQQPVHPSQPALERLYTDLKHLNNAPQPPNPSAAHSLLNSRASLHSNARHHQLLGQQHNYQTGQAQHWISGQAIHQHSQAAQHHISGLGGQGRHTLSANQSHVAIQAQGGNLRLDSQGQLSLGSQSGQINLNSSQSITLSTGGASIKISSSGIEIQCSGKLNIKASKIDHQMGGGQNASLPVLPNASGIFSRRFDLSELLPKDLLTQGVRYKLVNHSRKTETEAVLGQDGRTVRVFGDQAEQVEMIIEGVLVKEESEFVLPEGFDGFEEEDGEYD
ncbi:MAG: contractile injection system protein, VgrG/Pvc8 family [Pseudomonadota bacterium]|nr:contractile injection system protein, VgrG/Pvc8 family [Pseudomonadota bacterium]